MAAEARYCVSVCCGYQGSIGCAGRLERDGKRGRTHPSEPAHSSAFVGIDLGNQLAGNQGRRHHGATDLVRVLALRDCDLLPICVRVCVGRHFASAAIRLASGRGFRAIPDGGIFGPDRAGADHPATGSGFGARLLDPDLGYSACCLVAG